jgi:hypothetical protein
LENCAPREKENLLFIKIIFKRMKDKSQIVEINLRYNGHIVNMLHNVASLEGHKESIEYRSFKAVFGDLLYKMS